MTPARLAEIRERLASVSTILPSPSVTFRLHQDGNAMIGGWTDTATDADIGNVERFLECARQDLADLLAEVERLSAVPAGKVARWADPPGKSGGRLVSAAGSTLWTYYRRDDGRWNIDNQTVMYPSAITEDAARAFIEGKVAQRGWEVQP